jgi:transposase
MKARSGASKQADPYAIPHIRATRWRAGERSRLWLFGRAEMPILEAWMWTPEDRVLVGDFGSGQALSADQYRLIEPFIPPPKRGGRPRTTDVRLMLDGLFYVVRTGCQWRHLPPPPAFPPWQTVYGYFRTFLPPCNTLTTSRKVARYRVVEQEHG